MNSDVIMLLAVIVIGMDVLTNAFLLIYAPKWESLKRNEVRALREQNAELKAFIREVLNSEQRSN